MTAYKCLQNKTKNCKRTFKVFDIANSRCTQSVLVYQQQMLTIMQLYEQMSFYSPTNASKLSLHVQNQLVFPKERGRGGDGYITFIYNIQVLQTYVC